MLTCEETLGLNRKGKRQLSTFLPGWTIPCTQGSRGGEHEQHLHRPGPMRAQDSQQDYTTPGMQTMSVENQVLDPRPNGYASEQQNIPVHFKAIKRRLLQPFYKHKKAAIALSCLIFSSASFGLGTLVSLNRQKEAIKCPPDWIGHQGHCYKFSTEEKNWKESQDFCILHDASLAKITGEEMYLVTKITRNNVFWIGLKRELDQPWKWLDGDNATLKVLGNGGDCAFLNDDGTASSGRCSTEHHYICKKN